MCVIKIHLSNFVLNFFWDKAVAGQDRCCELKTVGGGGGGGGGDFCSYSVYVCASQYIVMYMCLVNPMS